jgi:hypothetical protein
MSFRERAAGAGFQISLEPLRGLLSGELNRYDDAPGAATGGVTVLSGVVPHESFRNVARKSDVMPLGRGFAAEDVEPSRGRSKFLQNMRVAAARTQLLPHRTTFEIAVYEVRLRGFAASARQPSCACELAQWPARTAGLAEARRRPSEGSSEVRLRGFGETDFA